MNTIDIEFKKHKFITLVEDDFNALGIIRSLGEEGIKPIVILISEHPSIVNHCKYLGTLHRVNSLEEGYDTLLSKYGNEELKPFLFCSEDKTISYLDNKFEDLCNRFILFNAGESGRINWLLNKDNITNLGKDVGFMCPPKEVVDTGNLPHNLRYPIITKVLASTMGAWKEDVFICNNESELLDAYKKIQSPKLCLQEYIQKRGEYCLEGFSINDGKDVFIPFTVEYIRLYDNSYGHYMIFRPFNDSALREKIEKILNLSRFNGIFEIEFMKGPNNEDYFLEVNFRPSLWNYSLTIGGGNLPYFWAKSMLAGRILYDEMNIRKEPFTAMHDFVDFKNNVLRRKVSLFQWIKEFKSCECHYQYNKKDPKPFWSYLRIEIKRLIRKFILRK